MIKLKILKHKIFMPNKLDEVTLSKGIMIMENLKKEPDLANKIAIISLLSNLDVDILVNIEDESIEKIWRKLDFSEKKVKATFFKSFKLNKTFYHLIDIDNLTVKDYAEIEFLLTEGESPFSNVDKIMQVLYRPVTHKNTSFKNILLNIAWRLRYKGIIPQVVENAKLGPIDENLGNLLLNKADFAFGYGVIAYLYEALLLLKNDYKLLFPEKLEDSDYDEEEKDQEEFANIWGLYGVIISISNDLFERDAWYEKPIRELFKFLTYQKQKNIYDGRRRSRS